MCTFKITSLTLGSTSYARKSSNNREICRNERKKNISILSFNQFMFVWQKMHNRHAEIVGIEKKRKIIKCILQILNVRFYWQFYYTWLTWKTCKRNQYELAVKKNTYNPAGILDIVNIVVWQEIKESPNRTTTTNSAQL